MPRLNYAFLVLKEHPYGREMLMQLLEAGLEPSALIEEAFGIADEEREKFLTRIRGHRVAPTFTELLRDRDVPRFEVPNHNGRRCSELLTELSPDLGVLGGTRILRRRILRIPPDGMLNSHPGLLPEMRGSASVAWSIYHDVPIGCTYHFIDEGIDTGPIIGRREIPVHRGDTYELLCWKTLVLSGALMTEAIASWSGGSLKATPQGKGRPAFRNAPPEVLEVVHRKLVEGTYRHLVD
jgi:methionyl-tRNA formyltransferase